MSSCNEIGIDVRVFYDNPNFCNTFYAETDIFRLIHVYVCIVQWIYHSNTCITLYTCTPVASFERVGRGKSNTIISPLSTCSLLRNRGQAYWQLDTIGNFNGRVRSEMRTAENRTKISITNG